MGAQRTHTPHWSMWTECHARTQTRRRTVQGVLCPVLRRAHRFSLVARRLSKADRRPLKRLRLI